MVYKQFFRTIAPYYCSNTLKMKLLSICLLTLFLFVSCSEVAENPDQVDSTKSQFFLHPDFKFGNKMVQNLFSDEQAIYVAHPMGVYYYTNDRKHQYFGQWMENGVNPSVNYFLDNNWAIAPYEKFNALSILQKTSSLGYALLRPQDFPKADYNYLAFDEHQPSYAINGKNFLFAVHSKQSNSIELIFAELDIQTSNSGDGLFIAPNSQPILSHKVLELEKIFNLNITKIKSITNLNNSFLVQVSAQGNDDLTFTVGSDGEVARTQQLANAGITLVVDLTSNASGDIFILGKSDNSDNYRIVKLPQGNVEQPLFMVDFQMTRDSKLRIINDEVILFNKHFPILYHIDFEGENIKAINTEELGFITYNDLIEHQGKVYIATNNGLYFCEISKFFSYMEADKFLEGSLYPEYFDVVIEAKFN